MLSIPQSRILLGFTTSNAPTPPPLTNVPLSDKALGVHRVTAATTHNLVNPPVPLNGDDTQLAWEATYPEGSINPGNKTTPPGGFGFYLRGPPEFARALQDHNSYTEVVMGYDVLFQEHFEFRLGGKLPGVCEMLPVCAPDLKLIRPVQMVVPATLPTAVPGGDKLTVASASICD